MFFMCFLLWEKNISKSFSSMILSILSSAYGVGFERRCIGDKPDVQYHYFYKSCSQEAIAYIYHRLDSFLYWTTEHVFSVFFVQANHARICPWKHRFNLYFFGVPFDQRHVVWRYLMKEWKTGLAFCLRYIVLMVFRKTTWVAMCTLGYTNAIKWTFFSQSKLYLFDWFTS